MAKKDFLLRGRTESLCIVYIYRNLPGMQSIRKFYVVEYAISSYSGTKSTVHVGGKAKQFSSLFFFLCVWWVHLLEVKKVKVSFKELWKNFLKRFFDFSLRFATMPHKT